MLFHLLGGVQHSLRLLRSSVAFLAVPNMVDIAQFFIIVSIGLSLGCVVMGFNGLVDEKLSELQYTRPHISQYAPPQYFFSQVNLRQYNRSNKELTDMARAMEQHYTMLLLSVLCFFLSVFAFTAYNIYASVFVTKSFTVRYLFFAMAASGLIIAMGVILRWNRQFL